MHPPRVGTFEFIVGATDSADPPNAVAGVFDITVNERLQFDVAEFASLAVGHASSFELGRLGGTDPLDLDRVGDALIDGLTLDSDTAMIEGVPVAPGSAEFELDAVDAAGDVAIARTTVVACERWVDSSTAFDLAEGDSAAGVFVDVVKGAQISVSVKTARRKARRNLRVVLVDASGRSVHDGPGKRSRAGRGKLPTVVAPESGRYFVIVESEDGEPTELQAKVRVRVGRGRKGVIEDFELGRPSVVRFGALAGAKFVLNAGAAKGSELSGVKVQGLLAPDGSIVRNDELDIRTKGDRVTVSGSLPQSGTWGLILSPLRAPDGPLRFKLSVKQPKSGSLTAD